MKYSKRQFLTINGRKKAVRLLLRERDVVAYESYNSLIIYTKTSIHNVLNTSKKYPIARNFIKRGTYEDQKLFYKYFNE